ncbi:hypothetical protein ELI54_08515 [Rhizobium ruizarguesonis]|uniref:hypothetical protein n=1 Tax=Rhizobium ruizarguesonis TaxID=2081791 RepID=UPI0010301392|nr:hypothetical protein [Rhizobium ruizarguesonis]TAT88246.1 hypothetical protein ELI54_08515 [Rhizobium ruizarguesonis]
MALEDRVQQKLHEAKEASKLSGNRPRFKGPSRPVFRSKTVRDMVCILDLNPGVRSWSCPPPPLAVGRGGYTPDLHMEDTDGTSWLLDAPDRKVPFELGIVVEAARAQSHLYRVVDRSEIYDGFRLQNAKDLLRYVGHNVPLGDRIRLLSVLDEHGPLSLADCLRAVRETQPVPALASLILQGLLEVELDEALIGPETMVRRIRA